MGQSTKGSIKMERKMEGASSHLLMVVIMMENLDQMRFQEEANTSGLMESFMKANGKRIKCMVMAL